MGISGQSYYICNPCKIIGGRLWLAYHITFGQIYQESICIISLLLRFAFLKYTKPDKGLIQNLQVSFIGCFLSSTKTIFVFGFIHWSKPILGIFFMPKNHELDDIKM